MKRLIIGNICLALLVCSQIWLMVQFIERLSQTIENYRVYVEYYEDCAKRLGEEYGVWDSSQSIKAILREAFSLLICICSVVCSALLFIKSNFSNSAKLSYEERKKYLQEKQAEKKQAKIEKLKNQIEEIEKDA